MYLTVMKINTYKWINIFDQAAYVLCNKSFNYIKGKIHCIMGVQSNKPFNMSAITGNYYNDSNDVIPVSF